jgi:hypothetical protein
MAQIVAKGAALARIGSLLHVTAAHVLPWRSLAGIGLAAFVSAGPALWAQAHLVAPPLVAGAIIAAVYGITYAAIVATYLGVSPGAIGRRLKWQGTEGR